MQLLVRGRIDGDAFVVAETGQRLPIRSSAPNADGSEAAMRRLLVTGFDEGRVSVTLAPIDPVPTAR